MNKKELVLAVAEKAGLEKKQAEAAVKAFLEAVVETVAKKEEVRLVGFGSFAARDRAKRKAKNPQTGKAITIPARTVPAFHAGKAFKEAVNVKPAKKKKK